MRPVDLTDLSYNKSRFLFFPAHISIEWSDQPVKPTATFVNHSTDRFHPWTTDFLLPISISYDRMQTNGDV